MREARLFPTTCQVRGCLHSNSDEVSSARCTEAADPTRVERRFGLSPRQVITARITRRVDADPADRHAEVAFDLTKVRCYLIRKSSETVGDERCRIPTAERRAKRCHRRECQWR